MKTSLAFGMVACGSISGLLVGCARAPGPDFRPTPASAKLDAKFQGQVRELVRQYCGTPRLPKMLGESKADPLRLRKGYQVYTRRCAQCHGEQGDGLGPVAASLYPRPRDYRPGIFKFTSTSYGSKPLREDLARTIRRGILGTSMPAFPLLPPDESEAVVDYVLVLTHRGEFENRLADEIDFNGEIVADDVPNLAADVVRKWAEARGKVVIPGVTMPAEFTAEHIERGKTQFNTIGCASCHGEDGRGQTSQNLATEEGLALKDAWGFKTRAADLTSGFLRGGTEPLDIYRHIDAGINGTPMPAFHDQLASQPDKVWDIVGYVMHIADQRRRGMIPSVGDITPFPIAPASTANGTPAPMTGPTGG